MWGSSHFGSAKSCFFFFYNWGTHGKQLTDASISFVYSWILITIMTYHENLCINGGLLDITSWDISKSRMQWTRSAMLCFPRCPVMITLITSRSVVCPRPRAAAQAVDGCADCRKLASSDGGRGRRSGTRHGQILGTKRMAWFTAGV